MKKLTLLLCICCLANLFGFVVTASAQPQAICVPWQPANPAEPHFTYSGAEVTLKGIARGDAVEYSWDFGDGTGTVINPITDPYDLGVKHTYTGPLGQLFVATLSVSDGMGNVAQDEYLVQIYESSDLSIADHLYVRINMAIDEGLWWLHTTLIRDTYPAGSPGYKQHYGYWDPSYYPLPATATSLDAFQLHGSRANGDYATDPYVETVQRALNYLLYNTYAYNIVPQPAGDPDTNGNGIGLVANHSANLHDSRQTYIGGICMAALASSGVPNRVSAVGRDNVYNRTYADIVQDMVDFFAYGQVDSGAGRGGWRYYANYSGSDMSTTQWPPFGMMAAEVGMGSTVPPFVRLELPIFLDYTQHTACDTNNGVFGYSYDSNYANCTKAAAGIICHEFLGTPLTDPKVQSAIGFLYRHWNDSGGSWTYQRLLGNSYGMQGVMKAMKIPGQIPVYGNEILEITEYDCTIPAQTEQRFDWYYSTDTESHEGLAHYIVRTQQSDGSWDDVPGPNPVYDAFATGWRLLILSRSCPPPIPRAVICDCEESPEYELNQNIHLDGSCSFHADRNRNIVGYEWDFLCDGELDAVGPDATIAGGYPAEGYYPICLKVFDDTPGQPLTDTDACEIYVHPPPHCPVADANGPYEGYPGEAVMLNGCDSWDPNGDDMIFEWDCDNDGEYDDAIGCEAECTWEEEGVFPVSVRVTDVFEDGYEPCSDIDFTAVDIGNHAPVSDPNGPYSVLPGFCIMLDGSGSYDPDEAVGDTITYAWDLNNDGVFDDCVGSDSQCEMCVGPEMDVTYDICLKVIDTHEEIDIECTTTVGVIPYHSLIDIDPYSCPNPVNIESTGGKIRVTIMGTEELDVNDIDLASIVMTREGVEGEVAPTLNDYMDRATPFDGDLCSCADCADKDDCGPDGYGDLSVYFPLPELIEGLKLYEVEAMTVPLTLLATLEDGTVITGQDCVNVIKCDGDFDCDKDIDGKDATDFKKEFGRSLLADPCTAGDQCLGDFDGDQDCDGLDANAFKRDFGRSSFTYPCNGCCSE